MERSYAFESIEDPADPAWCGYAELCRDRWWHRRRSQLLLSLSMVALVMIPVAHAGERAGDGKPVAATRADGTPAAVIAPPVAATAGEPESAPVVKPAKARERKPVEEPAATSSHGHEHEYELTPADISAYVRTVGPSAGGSTFGQPGAVTGDVEGLGASMIAGLEGLAQRMGRSLTVVSGTRTRAEQEVLYRRFQSGTGNLAAAPGTSRHESGEAADVYVDGVALADVPGARELAASLGLGFPVPGEAWHVERVGAAPR